MPKRDRIRMTGVFLGLAALVACGGGGGGAAPRAALPENRLPGPWIAQAADGTHYALIAPASPENGPFLTGRVVQAPSMLQAYGELTDANGNTQANGLLFASAQTPFPTGDPSAQARVDGTAYDAPPQLNLRLTSSFLSHSATLARDSAADRTVARLDLLGIYQASAANCSTGQGMTWTLTADPDDPLAIDVAGSGNAGAGPTVTGTLTQADATTNQFQVRLESTPDGATTPNYVFVGFAYFRPGSNPALVLMTGSPGGNSTSARQLSALFARQPVP